MLHWKLNAVRNIKVNIYIYFGKVNEEKNDLIILRFSEKESWKNILNQFISLLHLQKLFAQYLTIATDQQNKYKNI